MRRLIALASILPVLLATPALAHAEKLAGGDWVMAGQTGRSAPYLRFEAGRVGGSGGCNRFGASYAQSGDSLSFSPVAATRMACKGEAMARERAFFGMLEQVKAMRLDGDTLKLLDGGGRVIATLTRRVAQ